MCAVLACIATNSFAHFPNREAKRVFPYIDVIPPIGKRLPLDYRRRYNRPKYICGMLAYLTEPTSQEAMAWHKAVHRGSYQTKMRTEMRYFYPKPWEVMQIGPRTSMVEQPASPEPEPAVPEPAVPAIQQRYGEGLPDAVYDVLELSEQAE